jgi:hypothetical protein
VASPRSCRASCLLTREVGIDVRWDGIKGGEAFFAPRRPCAIPPEDHAVFRETTGENLRTLALGDDVVFIHDPISDVGGGASDVPESHQVLSKCRAGAAGDPDIHVIELPPDTHLEVNALQGS